MFIRTKRQKKNGRVYTYRVREERKWVNGKVKSIYLGRVDDEYDRLMERVLATAERQAREIAEWQRKTYGETAGERKEREGKEHLARLHKDFGLKLGPAIPVPVEPPAPSAATGGQMKGPAEDAEPGSSTPSAET
jgi:hypothetical protein